MSHMITSAMAWCDGYTAPLLVPLNGWLQPPLPLQIKSKNISFLDSNETCFICLFFVKHNVTELIMTNMLLIFQANYKSLSQDKLFSA